MPWSSCDALEVRVERWDSINIENVPSVLSPETSIRLVKPETRGPLFRSVGQVGTRREW